MTHSALTPLLGREFDDFLFASIGEDRNGTALSVLSALARLDVDPWKESARLARMPRERATERLAELIAATQKDFAPGLSAATIAARLMALLPKARTDKVYAPKARVKIPAVTPSRLLMALGVLALMFAGHMIFSDRSSPAGSPATTSDATAPH